MKIILDTESDMLFFRLNASPVHESEEVAPGVLVVYNKRGEVVGFELTEVSGRTPAMHMKTLEFHVLP